jgi:CRISPR system Cascade subunit CasC
MVLVEAGGSQPRTLANAFLKPVSQQPDLIDATYKALARHVADLDRMYGRKTDRRLAAIGPVESLAEALGAGEPAPLDEVAAWAAERVRGE